MASPEMEYNSDWIRVNAVNDDDDDELEDGGSRLPVSLSVGVWWCLLELKATTSSR